jgi:microcystin-dependent protein
MKKGALLTMLAIGITFSLTAQVGINTDLPHASAAMDIRSPASNDNRGVLLPRMTSNQRRNLANPAQSLLVFDTDQLCFFYYDGAAWISLVPGEKQHTPAPRPKVSGHIEIDTGSVQAPRMKTDTLEVSGFTNNALVPTGAILMWSGAAIPNGWALCDGTAGRPDLRGRFVVGFDPGTLMNPVNATADGTTLNYARLKNTGGEVGHVLSTDEIPAHAHDYNGTTTMDGNHFHDVQSYDGRENNNDGAGDRTDVARPGGSERTTTNGEHSHTFSGTTATNGTLNKPIENRPPYYVLAYIIKL